MKVDAVPCPKIWHHFGQSLSCRAKWFTAVFSQVRVDLDYLGFFYISSEVFDELFNVGFQGEVARAHKLFDRALVPRERFWFISILFTILTTASAPDPTIHLEVLLGSISTMRTEPH